MNAATDKARTPRDVLVSAWYLGRRNLVLVLWQILVGMASSLIPIAAVVVLVIALLIPALRYDFNHLGGIIGYALELYDRVRAPAFFVPFVLLAGSVTALLFATSAFVQAGVYGRLARALQPRGYKSGFWACAFAYFPRMVGYAGVRVLLELALAAVGAVTVLWPVMMGIDEIARTGHASFAIVLFTTLGCVLTASLGAVIYTWRMIALGPLLFDDTGVWHAYGEAALALGERLRAWLGIFAGIALIAAPAVLVYVAFYALLTALGQHEEYAMLAMLAQALLDMCWAIATALLMVLGGAAFLVEFARHREVIPDLPGPSPLRSAPPTGLGLGAPRTPLRFGQPIELPGAQLVVMPVPNRYPNLVDLSAVLGPRPSDGPDAGTISTELEDERSEIPATTESSTAAEPTIADSAADANALVSGLQLDDFDLQLDASMLEAQDLDDGWLSELDEDDFSLVLGAIEAQPSEGASESVLDDDAAWSMTDEALDEHDDPEDDSEGD